MLLISIHLFVDTQKSANGFLTLKAYRLTPQAINMYKDSEFTPEALRNLKIGFENLFIEIPIEVRNSPLTNIMLSELTEMVPEEEGNKFLDLGTAYVDFVISFSFLINSQEHKIFFLPTGLYWKDN